ncbi:MAG: ATPase [Dethiosulfatibacter sp.]|nr:ATPase [Dethiosulfatibacter sp.]
MEIISLLEKIEDIVEEASKLPMSSKVLIDKHEVLEIITEMRIKLPDEIKQASWIKEERQRILSETQTEASNIINDAMHRQELLIDEHELAKLAEQHAREIEEKARRTAFEVKKETIEYCDKLFSKTQDGLESMLKQLMENREELNKM